ncbi:MAG: hypothetical protein IV104_13070 [Acidovorax sp.]|nr:hypothetical protein [Acidovorax sp.]
MSFLSFKFGKLIVLALVMTAAGGAVASTFTLYRNSPLDPSMRLHVATFDAADGEQYNRENCNLAADLFSRQGGVKTRFWCEAGRFRK